MGSVFKKTATKPLPAHAKIAERKGGRIAEWLDAKGKRRTAPITVPMTGKYAGQDRIVIAARTYTAKYRDGTGIVREVATGCRDESAARSVLGELERRAEMVKGGIVSAAEDAMMGHQATPITEHVDTYLQSLESAGRALEHRNNCARAIRRIVADCRFSTLSDLRRESLEYWLLSQTKSGMGARTRNLYRGAIVSFCNWCLETGRLASNPFLNVEKANEKTDVRRQRRSLTEVELCRLLEVARLRPLAEYGRITVAKPEEERKGRRDSWQKLPLTLEDLDAATERAKERLSNNPDFVASLEFLGLERALIYKTLVLTGLRKGELASITVGQLDLDAPIPSLSLHAADEKNREGSTIPLRADLVEDLRQWLSAKESASQELADNSPTVQLDPKHQNRRKCITGASKGLKGQNCLPLPGVRSLSPDTPLFIVPSGLVTILNRDLRLAEIPKKDERGRTVDVHALRHTFGTLLSRCGVTPRTAQAAMRHSKIDLTMNTYTDPKLLDVAGALDSLPNLPLEGGRQKDRIAASATGTDNTRAIPFAPGFAPTPGNPCKLQSLPGKAASYSEGDGESRGVDVSACPVNRNNPLTIPVNGLQKGWLTGLEPATSRSTIWKMASNHRLSNLNNP